MSSSSDSDESGVEENLRNLAIEDKDINILLLGETGVGKSTFINAFANYLSQKFFRNAEKNGLVILIPSVFKMIDKYGKEREVRVGPTGDKNELLETGVSATQEIKTYVFPVWKGRVNVRLIDTPGMGDTRGIEQDEQNCANIFRYLKSLKKIHAICFLLKPTEARRTVFFEYCLYQLLSRLDKNASKNIFFLFTHTRGSNYGPGDTFPTLKKFIDYIQKGTSGVDISIEKNKFSFDNESFRFLAALEKYMQFDDSIKEVNCKSWEESAKQCWSFIRCLQKEITPFSTDVLFALNTSRSLIFKLSKVLYDITKLIENNCAILDRLNTNRISEEDDIERLKNEQSVVTDDVEHIKVSQPILVCTSAKCSDVHRVNGNQKLHHKNVCHGTCYEVSNITKEVVGCPGLVNCDVINKTTRLCTQCDCDFSVHMHVDYITRLTKNYTLDDQTAHRIAARLSMLESSKEIAEDINIKNTQLRCEYESIQKLCSSIAHFLQNNAIIVFSKSYKEYMVYMMNERQSSKDKALGVKLKERIQEYEEMEKVYSEALKTPVSSMELSLGGQEHYENQLQLLTKLEFNGEKIRQIYDEIKLANEAPPSIKKEYVHEKYYEGDNKKKNRKEFKNKGNNQKNSEKQNNTKGSKKKQQDTNRRSNNSSGNNYQQRSDTGSHPRPNQRVPQEPSWPPPVPPQGAHGGYPPYPENYARGPNDPPRAQHPRHDSYNFNVKIDNRDRSPPPLYSPGPSYGHPPQFHQHPGQHVPYLDHHVPYPSNYGGYPPQGTYSSVPHHPYPPEHTSFARDRGRAPPSYDNYRDARGRGNNDRRRDDSADRRRGKSGDRGEKGRNNDRRRGKSGDRGENGRNNDRRREKSSDRGENGRNNDRRRGKSGDREERGRNNDRKRENSGDRGEKGRNNDRRRGKSGDRREKGKNDYRNRNNSGDRSERKYDQSRGTSSSRRGRGRGDKMAPKK